MPPRPNKATTRQRSARSQRRSVSASAARPWNALTSGASPQSGRGPRACSGGSAPAAPPAAPAAGAPSAAPAGTARGSVANQVSSKGGARWPPSRRSAAHSARAPAPPRPTPSAPQRPSARRAQDPQPPPVTPRRFAPTVKVRRPRKAGDDGPAGPGAWCARRPPMGRDERHADRTGTAAQRRAPIIAATMRLIARDGIAALSTRTIAREAAVNLGTVYDLVGRKDDLLLAV